MGRKLKKSRACLVVLAAMFVFCGGASARLRSLYLSWLPQYSDAIAVCRVQRIQAGEEGYIGNTPILTHVAEMEVVRAWPADAQGLAPGDHISPRFLELDPDKGPRARTDMTPEFRRFEEAACYLVTLKRDGDEWQLARNEDRGWVWEAQDRALEGFTPSTSGEFILGELAATLCYADYPTLNKLVRTIDDVTFWDDGSGAKLLDLIEQHVSDPGRWLDIATASYMYMPTSRERFAALQDSNAFGGPLYTYLSSDSVLWLALKHLTGADVLRTVTLHGIEQFETHPRDVAAAIGRNFPDDPEMLGAIASRLSRGEPAAIRSVALLVRSPEHPLAGLAIAKALEELRRPDALERKCLRDAVDLVFHYGDDNAYSAMLDLVKESQVSDHPRFVALISSCMHERDKRALAVLRLAIQDQGETNGIRIDEGAVVALEWVIQRDLGYRRELPDADRRKAVERAKAWLAANDDIPPPPAEDPTMNGFPPWVAGWESR